MLVFWKIFWYVRPVKKRGRPRLMEPHEFYMTCRTGFYYRRSRHSAYDGFYCRVAVRYLCQRKKWKEGRPLVRTHVTQAAHARWPWLFGPPNVRWIGLEDGSIRKRRTILAALGRCDPALMPEFADRLCKLKPTVTEAIRLVRVWRKEAES